MNSSLEVRIVQLDPARVAYAIGFGKEPEGIAWNKLMTWAEQAGLLADLRAHRFFGFNNPDPTPGSPNYGYEQWMTVGPEVSAVGEAVKIKDFAGGLYAVARCQGPQNIFQTWQDLLMWCENSAYKMAAHQCLEECLSTDLIRLAEVRWEKVFFDLYVPVAA